MNFSRCDLVPLPLKIKKKRKRKLARLLGNKSYWEVSTSKSNLVKGRKEGRRESWMRGQQTCPLYNITYQHVNSKLGRQHTKAPLAAAIGPFFYELNYWSPHKTHDVNDVWRLPTSLGSTSNTLFEQWCGFFYVPQEQIGVSAVRRLLRFFILNRED